MHRLFTQFTNSTFTISPYTKSLDHPADFSFTNKSLFQTLDKLVKNTEKCCLRSTFDKLKGYFEGLSTTRLPENRNGTYSEEMIEKTENISKRIHGIIDKITEKERINKQKKLKEEQKKVPKLKIAKVLMQDPRKKKDFIMENRCKELQDDLNDLCQHEIKAKVVKAWKSFLYFRKEKQLKIKSLVTVRFLIVAQKIFHRVFSYTKEQQLKRAKLGIVRSFVTVNYLRKGMIGLHQFQVKARRMNGIIKTKEKKILQVLFEGLKKNYLAAKVKRLRYEKGDKRFLKCLLSKVFKEFKIRAKEIQIKKNQEELVRVFLNDKLICIGFSAWVKGRNILRERGLKANLAFEKYSKNAKKRFFNTLKAGCLLALKHRHIKTLSFLHFSTKSKQKFVEKLQALVNTKKLELVKERKAEIFYFFKTSQKVLRTWYSFTQVYRDKKLQNYKSFLIHCKKLIENSFFGWKKQYPRERYRRLRTLRLENTINWNIIDSYFCDWLQLAAARVKFSNECVKKYKLKVLKGFFGVLKENRVKKLGKQMKNDGKIKKLLIKKKSKFFEGMKKYFFLRIGKNEQKYSAEQLYIRKIFKKWNKLGKIKAYLKYLTKYHYSKFLFIRWRDYSIEACLLNYANDHNQTRLKSKVLQYFKSIHQKHQILKEKLNSYQYYKDLKILGLYFDSMLSLSIYKSISNN